MVSPIFTSDVCIPVKTRSHHYSKTVMTHGRYGLMMYWSDPDLLLTYVDEVVAFIYLWVHCQRSCCLSFR